jgi:hypothetical protein
MVLVATVCLACNRKRTPNWPIAPDITWLSFARNATNFQLSLPRRRLVWLPRRPSSKTRRRTCWWTSTDCTTADDVNSSRLDRRLISSHGRRRRRKNTSSVTNRTCNSCGERDFGNLLCVARRESELLCIKFPVPLSLLSADAPYKRSRRLRYQQSVVQLVFCVRLFEISHLTITR